MSKEAKTEISEIDVAKLAEDFDKLCSTLARSFCKYGREILTETARSAMEEFYGAHNPYFYNRTKNLAHKSYKKYYHDNGRTVYGGVRISSDNMNSNYFSKINDDFMDMKGTVAWSAWHGWHGLPPRVVDENGDRLSSETSDGYWTKQTSKPILKVMEMMKNEDFLKDAGAYAREQAKSLKYNYIIDASKYF